MACSSGEENVQELNAAASALQEALDEAATEVAEAADEPAADEPAADEPAADEPAADEPSDEGGTRYTCDQGVNHICYQTTPMAALIPGEQMGCEGAGAIGTWTEGGECPTENIIGTCQKERNNETRYFYEGLSAVNAEAVCTAFGGTFTASE